VIAAPGRIADPRIGQAAAAPEFRDPMLDLLVTVLALLDRLGQAGIRHAIEDMADALRVISAQDVDNLVVELVDLISRPAGPLYEPRLISRRHHPAFAMSTIGSPDASARSLAPIRASGRELKVSGLDQFAGSASGGMTLTRMNGPSFKMAM